MMKVNDVYRASPLLWNRRGAALDGGQMLRRSSTSSGVVSDLITNFRSDGFGRGDVVFMTLTSTTASSLRPDSAGAAGLVGAVGGPAGALVYGALGIAPAAASLALAEASPSLRLRRR